MDTSITTARRKVLGPIVIASLGGVLALGGLVSAVGAQSGPAVAHTTTAKPTIVLVHGAFADASGWGAVIVRLEADGYPVIAPPDPLRGLSSDSAYIASVLAQTPGPLVVVGHSYGGAVITNAAAGNANVKALVYIDAFIPDVGEDTLSLAGADSGLVPSALDFKGFPPFGPNDVDISINKASFHQVFCADLSTQQAAIMWATQRPAAAATTAEKTTQAAWKTIPSWALIGRQDHAITPTALRFMATRAGSHIKEINSSHVSMISHPAAVSDLIEAAAKATS